MDEDKRLIDMDDGPGTLLANEVMLSPDDFDSKVAYEDFLKQNHQVSQVESSATPELKQQVPTKKINAELSLTFVGLPNTNVVQSIYVGTTNVYALQFVTGGAKQLLSKCRMDKGKKTATCMSTMTLYNFGHGQTLQYFSRNGKDYFWVVCKATNLAIKEIPKANFNWGIQIGRLEFKDGATINNYTDIPRFAGINYANKAGKKFGSVYRVEAALSSDTNSLLMWMKNTASGVQFSYYDAHALNVLLDKKEHQSSKWIGCEEDPVKAACKGQVQFDNNHWGVPNSNSTQGLEFSDGRAIYISSGTHNYNNPDQPKIGKYFWGNGFPNMVIQLVSSQITSRIQDNEIEGIQLKGNDIFVSQHFHKNGTRPVAQTIYKIPKSAFN